MLGTHKDLLTVLSSKLVRVVDVKRRCTVSKDDSTRNLFTVCVVFPWICLAALFEGACVCTAFGPKKAENKGRSTRLMIWVLPQPPPPISKHRTRASCFGRDPFAVAGNISQADCRVAAMIATKPAKAGLYAIPCNHCKFTICPIQRKNALLCLDRNPSGKWRQLVAKMVVGVVISWVVTCYNYI